MVELTASRARDVRQHAIKNLSIRLIDIQTKVHQRAQEPTALGHTVRNRVCHYTMSR